jgi:hypothetical protein
VVLPAVELAVTTDVGEHDDIDVSYGELGSWVVANALAVAGPLGRPTWPVRGTPRPGGLADRDRLAGLPRDPAMGRVGSWARPRVTRGLEDTRCGP